MGEPQGAGQCLHYVLQTKASEVIFIRNHASAIIGFGCCPNGQLHRVALCSESVELGERASGDKVSA